MHLALNYQSFEALVDPKIYAGCVQYWLDKAREIAVKKVNGTCVKQAPRLCAKRSPTPSYEPGNLFLERRSILGEGLTTNLLRK